MSIITTTSAFIRLPPELKNLINQMLHTNEDQRLTFEAAITERN